MRPGDISRPDGPSNQAQEGDIPDHGAGYWDERYRASQSVWGAAPNRWVAAELADLPPGDGVDLACGEGRNAIWLARRGWRVTAADYSAVALERGRAAGAGWPIEWVLADVTEWQPPAADLVLVCYLQLTAAAMRRALANAAAALRPGGTMLVIGHDARNLIEGVGGPQDRSVLYTPDEVSAALADLQVDRAETVLRPVEGADRPALDVLVRATRA